MRKVSILAHIEWGRFVSGFTLAEVLITLGIIGIVATMTMPTLVANYQKKQTATQLKKVYSELYQALTLSEVEYGPAVHWDFGGSDDFKETSKFFFENYLKLKLIEECYPTNDKCWADTWTSDKAHVQFKGYMGFGGYSSVITSSGYALFSQINQPGGQICVDLNGKKPPNQLGKDVFQFKIRLNESFIFEPFSATIESEVKEELCSKSCVSNGNYACGRTCAARIQENGWEIPDDYPW